MAKKGMKRPEMNKTQAKNKSVAVPEMQEKAKQRDNNARLVNAGTQSPEMRVYREKQNNGSKKQNGNSVYDNDLARDNLENDLTSADRQDN